METVARNATLADLAEMLKTQHARKVDMVVGAANVYSQDGAILIRDVEPILEEDGVTDPNGVYLPTAVFDEGVAAKFGIPVGYVRKMRAERLDLYDANLNGWLRGRRGKVRYGPKAEVREVLREEIPADPRSFLLRAFKGDDGPGIARALLSDSYKVIDHLDALTAALDGVRDAGVTVSIDSADLTERRMSVRVVAPEITTIAEDLLRGYRNPFPDIERWRQVADREGLGYGADEKTVFAGFQISNSETGGGAYSIVPRIVVKVCKNGLTITKDALRAVHLGGKLEEGLINWSDETQQKAIDLVRAKTADAVRTFLDGEYLQRLVAGLEEKATEEVSSMDQVKVITKRLQFSQEHTDGVLEYFVRGGQMTLGGVTNAVTAYAQTVDDPDVAYDLEAQAVRVLI